ACIFVVQAREGKGDGPVSGVKACALPIWRRRVCKAWARMPYGIANARARSVAAPIANRELQKSTGEGRKCSQLFPVEHKGAWGCWGVIVAGQLFSTSGGRGAEGEEEADWHMSGTLDRVTGSLIATSIRRNPDFMVSLDLQCKPTQRMF